MMIIISLLVLALIILVHEWGHFMAARSAGIEVLEFSIGFGPKLFSVNRPYKKGGANSITEFSLRLFPLGGFVRMAGTDPDDEDHEHGFNKASPLQRIKVLAAGPVMNFVLAVFLFVFAFTVIGIPQPVENAIIGEIIDGRPAATAGLMTGDEIVAANGQRIQSWEQLVGAIQQTPREGTLLLQVKRDGQLYDMSVKPEYDTTTQTMMLGISSMVTFHKMGLWQGIKMGFVNTYQTTVAMLQGLGQIITGAVSTKALAGPVGITKMIGQAAQGGFIYLLNFTALLSINLGIINLIPFPALDGSRIVFTGIEMVRGRPIEPEREGFIHLLGFMVLMGLILLVTYNDIFMLLKGG
ncbi:MAG: RIP metalloprotease RseP [Syntrophomonadaceae bacterium]|nr:RIP metalloprotease RseP [Syntrophomonadaceae bacterium]